MQTTYLVLNDDGAVALCHLDEADIRAAHPHTCFASPLMPADVEGLGYVAVEPTAPPPHSVWTHRVVQGVPVIDGDVWRQVWQVEPLAAEKVTASFAERQKQLAHRIDTEMDGVIQHVVGARAAEYERAEREAAEFRDAGYEGDVPAYVQADADAYQQTPRWSAERILTAAEKGRVFQMRVRDVRLSNKARVAMARTHEALDEAEKAWTLAWGEMRAAVGLA